MSSPAPKASGRQPASAPIGLDPIRRGARSLGSGVTIGQVPRRTIRAPRALTVAAAETSGRFCGSSLRLCLRQSGARAGGRGPRRQERDVPAGGGRRPGARQAMRSRIERPAADEMWMELGSAERGSRAIGGNPIGHGLHPPLRRRRSNPRSPRLGDARATFLTICFRCGPALHIAAQGFRIITSPPRGSEFLPTGRAALKKVMSSM